MALDPLQTILDLLSTNWTSSNTDNLTPQFSKITDVKRADFNKNNDWVLAHRTRPLTEAAGVGKTRRRVSDLFDLDIRTHEQTTASGVSIAEPHFLKVVQEVEDILGANIYVFSNDYDLLDPDGQQQDLSDGMRRVWRKLVPVKLVRLNIAR